MSIWNKLSLGSIGPGVLVAATGVGAGDLATASFTGATLGTGILWAVLVGAALKYVLNEGLARWQLVTGSTLLEGTSRHLGQFALWLFVPYLIVWTFLVSMSLMSACGVAAHALIPIFENPSHGKIVFGVVQSLLATLLILVGGYSLFERTMSFCIGIMFVVCCLTAIALRPSFTEVLSGLVVPRIPMLGQGGLAWTVALLGGVGGTVTVLCYGYWIREEGREQVDSLPACRLDLAIGYGMTALFGLSMVVIGSQLGQLDGTGATLIVEVANVLQTRLGSLGTLAKWGFLLGAWGAVFSSLLGVWQSVPYLFLDVWRLLGLHKKSTTSETRTSVTGTAGYRVHLAAIAGVPIVGLALVNFKLAMQINGIVGALFIPMLAIALLLLNGRKRLMGEHKNSTVTSLLLLAVLAVCFATMVFKATSS
ncbi:MAG: Nramp family divalent metal transporter [Planctomycetales bacterium]|nr:Nramp family divalent metal transporter [Planctomycetales bacterium]